MMAAYDTPAKAVTQRIGYILADDSRKACHKHAVDLNVEIYSKKKKRKGDKREQDPDYKASLGSEMNVMCQKPLWLKLGMVKRLALTIPT